jgi:hypothetical protein
MNEIVLLYEKTLQPGGYCAAAEIKKRGKNND